MPIPLLRFQPLTGDPSNEVWNETGPSCGINWGRGAEGVGGMSHLHAPIGFEEIVVEFRSLEGWPFVYCLFTWMKPVLSPPKARR